MITLGTIRLCMLARPRLPNSQKVISGRVVSGLARYCALEIIALNIAPMITPPSTRMISEPRPTTRAIVTASTAASSPQPKEIVCSAAVGRPIRIDTDAPKPAPAATPSTSGETSGLRNIVW